MASSRSMVTVPRLARLTVAACSPVPFRIMANPASQFPRTMTSKFDELLLVLHHLLPSPIRQCWLHMAMLEKLLVDGGLSKLPSNALVQALKKRAVDISLLQEKFMGKRWYCFEPADPKYQSPRDQAGFLKAAASEEEREAIVPPIPSHRFFKKFKFTFIEDYIVPPFFPIILTAPPRPSESPAAVAAGPPLPAPASAPPLPAGRLDERSPPLQPRLHTNASRGGAGDIGAAVGAAPIPAVPGGHRPPPNDPRVGGSVHDLSGGTGVAQATAPGCHLTPKISE